MIQVPEIQAPNTEVDFRETELYQRIGRILRANHKRGFDAAKEGGAEHYGCSDARAYLAGLETKAGDAANMLYKALLLLPEPERERILSGRLSATPKPSTYEEVECRDCRGHGTYTSGDACELCNGTGVLFRKVSASPGDVK